MKKNKKVKAAKAAKSSKPAKKNLLSGARKSLKKLGQGKLTTTQKVVGGAALVAMGFSYLAKRRKSVPAVPPTPAATDASAAEQNLASLDGGDI